ncbi:MAG: amidohydrolase family protein [Gammaproteobacteria bacterium]|nr:amidohydrolase family protein [Gammaproteobacteria bacterium]
MESPTTAAASNAAGDAPVTALVGGILIDGTGAAPLADAVVLIDGSEIASVGARGEVALPEGTRVVEIGGKWLVPGLIDAHVHFMESGRIYTKPGQIDLTHLVPYDEEVAWMQQRVPVTLKSYLCAGVTGAVSVGGPRFEYEVREQARARHDAPDVYVAHGPVTLVPAATLFPPFDGDVSVRSVTDPGSAAETIRQGAQWEADLVKTGYLGGPFADQEKDYAAMHEAIVAESAVHGFKVTTHVTELEPARTLVELGVDSLQHLPLDASLDAAFLELAKSSGVVVVPTLAVWRRNFVDVYDRSFDLLPIEEQCGDPQVIASWHEVGELPAPPPEVMEMYGGVMAVAAGNTKRLLDAGVPLAAGSDTGNLGLLHGPSLHYELKLLGEAGVPPAELIVAATLHAAMVAGQADRVGSIEPGKQADLLVIEADPLADIGNLQAIGQVIKSGVVFDPATFLPPAE